MSTLYRNPDQVTHGTPTARSWRDSDGWRDMDEAYPLGDPAPAPPCQHEWTNNYGQPRVYCRLCGTGADGCRRMWRNGAEYYEQVEPASMTESEQAAFVAGLWAREREEDAAKDRYLGEGR